VVLVRHHRDGTVYGITRVFLAKQIRSSGHVYGTISARSSEFKENNGLDFGRKQNDTWEISEDCLSLAELKVVVQLRSNIL